jgi:poly-gamma-glutamate synthesis protein (capsule biosynthesis protein)
MLRKTSRLICFILIISAIAACVPVAAQDADKIEPTPIPTMVPVDTLWFAPYLPDPLTAGFRLPENAVSTVDPNTADILVDVGSDHIIAQWTYVLVAPFPTVPDDVSFSALKRFWGSNEPADFPAAGLLVDGSTMGVLEKLWGVASPDHVRVVSRDQLLSRSWEERETWAIIPFEQLQPSWKVIAVDGHSPVRKDFNSQSYPLQIPFSLVGNPQTVAGLLERMVSMSDSFSFPLVNRDPAKMTTVMLTGVTALVRGTAWLMELNGMTYPARDLGDILRGADILHINNEVTFTDRCPNPFTDRAKEAMLIFCSKPQYIELLEAIGTDVVELAGDHLDDWGTDAMLKTLAMYDERGWQYYGGGKDLEDGLKPALFEHNGNRIAFLGCNMGKIPSYSRASETQPGAVHCEFDLMSEQIKNVLAEDYNPIFTFQHVEYYSYGAHPRVAPDFRTVAEAGALIVSGSQAHQPHTFEFYRDAFIHFGLGNLFFDQYYEGYNMRQAFIDVHVFYGNRHISTELITILFEDLARARLMNPEEREDLLQTVFRAGGW